MRITPIGLLKAIIIAVFSDFTIANITHVYDMNWYFVGLDAVIGLILGFLLRVR